MPKKRRSKPEAPGPPSHPWWSEYPDGEQQASRAEQVIRKSRQLAVEAWPWQSRAVSAKDDARLHSLFLELEETPRGCEGALRKRLDPGIVPGALSTGLRGFLGSLTRDDVKRLVVGDGKGALGPYRTSPPWERFGRLTVRGPSLSVDEQRVACLEYLKRFGAQVPERLPPLPDVLLPLARFALDHPDVLVADSGRVRPCTWIVVGDEGELAEVVRAYGAADHGWGNERFIPRFDKHLMALARAEAISQTVYKLAELRGIQGPVTSVSEVLEKSQQGLPAGGPGTQVLGQKAYISPDFCSIRWDNESVSLGAEGAKLFRALCEAHLEGKPWLTHADLARVWDSEGKRQIEFRAANYLKDVMDCVCERPRRGYYRIKRSFPKDAIRKALNTE